MGWRAHCPGRVKTVLDTVKRCNGVTKYGTVNYANPTGPQTPAATALVFRLKL